METRIGRGRGNRGNPQQQRHPQGLMRRHGSHNQVNEILRIGMEDSESDDGPGSTSSSYRRNNFARHENRSHSQVRNDLHLGQRQNRTPSTSSAPSCEQRSSSGGRGKYTNFRGGRGNFGNKYQRSASQNNSTQRLPPKNDNESDNSSRGRRPMGFKALQNLLEKNSEELIMELLKLNSQKGIAEFLKTNLSNDAIVLFIKVLRKVSDSSFDECKYKIFQIYFDEPFVDVLTKYIIYLPMQDVRERRRNSWFWDNPDDFWNNVITISSDILDSIQHSAIKVLPKLLKSLLLYIPTFEEEHQWHVSDEIKDKVKKLSEAVDVLVQENEEKEKSRIKNKVLNFPEEEPPDDFRQISVYPNSHELLGTNRGYLRPNVTKGPYRNVDHYLDVQFRLLREDFVGPLRTGIASYRKESTKKNENVKIYKRVRFLNPETINEFYCIRLKFDFTNKKKNFRYENSRRFMFGSLLCFTMDDFKTFIFGKVAERKVEDLEKGELIIGFDENVTVFYNKDYLMVECSVFFEPYFHVLNVMKNMSVDNFPMEKYIVNVDPTVDPPEYLSERNIPYVIERHEFYPLRNWPNRNFYNLNDSQIKAFKAAITQEFAIIQGPPGTGKTYLGLKIAKTLLDNRKAWYNHTPMLVICYTNHALDQFLEGILPFTDRIMRVGGQSKNDNLKSFNLKNRSRFKMNVAVFQQKDVVQRLLTRIKNISENLKEINYYHSIRGFDIFSDIVPEFMSTWFHSAKRDEILHWLLGGEEPSIDSTTQLMKKVEDQFNSININDNDDNKSENSDEECDSYDTDVDLEDADDDIFEQVFGDDTNVQSSSIPLITVKSLWDRINVVENALNMIHHKWQTEPPTFEELVDEENYRKELGNLRHDHGILTERLAEGKQKHLLEEKPKYVNLRDPYSMTPNDRWCLYFYWLNLYKKRLTEKLDRLNAEFREAFKVYEEMRNIEDTNAMKDVLVVGMTTTGAARLRSTLQTLKSPIVIVEEAAEVLEAHIITSLTKHCKHLILIGDHQQLKPSTADYSLEKHFNLGISLFERMVLNDIQCYTLNVQHRMRPEIANLVRPTIYPALEDHPSVTERTPILGIDNNLFFIDHKHKESDCEGTSKKNYHEVKFLICLAKYLILNGYKPENVTILAAYLGQMFELQKEKKKQKHILENVRIAVLDNYQGEESDIILLSLVRNNEENKIGFLSIENRVCVALSRARNGLYVMGNMTQLCNASELWQKIKLTFEEQNALGPELPLRCQIHRDTVTPVKEESDFLNVPEGGCNKKCDVELVCGHKCPSLCHILNRDHGATQCRATCGKRLCDEDETHLCKKLCYQECGPCIYLVQRKLSCGHIVRMECHLDPDKYDCPVRVSTQLPCGHVADKPCHCDPVVFKCPHPCETKVEPCGHACLLTCHIRRDPDHLEYKCRKPCARYRKGCTVKTENHLCRLYCYEDCQECTIPVKKPRKICPHFYQVPCNFDAEQIDCVKPCTKILDCGHKCKSKCNEPCGKCEVMVNKNISKCGHPVKAKCSEEPDWKSCNKMCPLQLSCGHPCTTKCNEPCTVDCKVMVDCNITASCGHVITKIICSLAKSEVKSKDLLKYCNKPCQDQLKCGHKCSGTCGECSQGRVHKRCNEKCGVPLVCDHLCEFPCREACRPCKQRCPYKCIHSACSKRCGEVCTPCQEKCSRKCQHQQCRKTCGEICDVSPCEKPCNKKLKCGHPCVGFCGDPCPPKCLVCDQEELTEIFFGFEGEEDARYVVLKDCGHIFENTGLEQWLQQNDDQITFKTCPRCKTTIKTTLRYSDQIKQAMADVAKVKAELYGTREENEKTKKKLEKQLTMLASKSTILSKYCPELMKVFIRIQKRLLPARKGQRQPISKHDLNSITSKLQIVEHIVKICCKTGVDVSSIDEIYFPQVRFISKVLLRDDDFITGQEIDDVNLELNRLMRIVEFSQIKKTPAFYMYVSTTTSIKNLVAQIENILYKTERFNELHEENVKQSLVQLSKLMASGIGISEKEKREIVTAMGFKKGHWYKCPNGHPYVIGECGGAMQVSVCNECGAQIGGSNHALLSTNAVATEMDGAAHGAWSEAANMGNYNLQEFL